MSELTRQQIEHLAELAHVHLTDEELDRVADELDSILNSMRRVQEIAGPDIPATSHPLPLENVFRDDVVRGVLDRDAALAGSPAVEDGQFRIPPILHREDA